MGKRYPLKAVRTLKKKEEEAKKVEHEENYSLQTEPTWEHKALSGTVSIFVVLGSSLFYGKPRKGGVSTRGETLAKELNPERSDFVFDRQPDAFRSGRAHQWLSGDI